jgi:hypothetical protein
VSERSKQRTELENGKIVEYQKNNIKNRELFHFARVIVIVGLIEEKEVGFFRKKVECRNY